MLSENYMPATLGGKGDYKMAFVDMEYKKHPDGWKTYCLVTMGYHIGSLIIHFKGSRKSDFLDMSLHHLVALYLYGGCYMCNVWECGGVIMLLHDIADISGNLTKGLGETIFPNFTGALFVLHMLIWAYTRMIVLPILIWQIGKYCSNMGDSSFVNPKWIFCYLLSCMVLLHTFWFSIFCKMIYNLINTGKSEDF